MEKSKNAELTVEAKIALREEIQAHLQAQYIKIFAALSVILVLSGVGITSFISNYIAQSVNESLQNSITTVQSNVQGFASKITSTLKEAKVLEEQIATIRTEVDNLTTKEINQRLANVNVKISLLEGEIKAFRTALLPDVEKLFLAKKIAEDVDRLVELERNVDASIERIENTVSTLQYWIWGTLLLIVGALATFVFGKRRAV